MGIPGRGSTAQAGAGWPGPTSGRGSSLRDGGGLRVRSSARARFLLTLWWKPGLRGRRAPDLPGHRNGGAGPDGRLETRWTPSRSIAPRCRYFTLVCKWQHSDSQGPVCVVPLCPSGFRDPLLKTRPPRS